MPETAQPVPPYMQVVATLRARIANEMCPGDPMPTIRQTAEEFGISYITAQKAFGVLVAEGLVEAARGQRSRVRAVPAAQHQGGHDRAMSVRRTGLIYTPGEYARVTSAEITGAPAQVATVLGIAAGAPVIRRARVTYGADDRPTSASVSWYDGALAEAAPQLLVAERLAEGSWAYLEGCTGRRAVSGQDRIDVRAATEEDAAALGIRPGTPLKLTETILWDSEGRSVEYGVSVASPGRRSVYDYEIG